MISPYSYLKNFGVKFTGVEAIRVSEPGQISNQPLRRQNRRNILMKSLIAAIAILVGLSVPALASQCPDMIKKAEEGLNKSTLDEAGKKKVSDHIAQAKAQHEAGQHDKSVATLKDAMSLLKM